MCFGFWDVFRLSKQPTFHDATTGFPREMTSVACSAGVFWVGETLFVLL